MTLRLRLLLSLVGLVAAGLLIADAATYLSLRSFLTDRVDQQLLAARNPIALQLTRNAQPFPRGRGADAAILPPGTYGQLRDETGRVLDTVTFNYGTETLPVPDLPSPLPEVGSGRQSVTFTTGARGSDSRFRVLVQDVDSRSYTLVVAIPLADMQRTLGRLVLIEIVVTVMVLAGLAALAWWLVRRDLQPRFNGFLHGRA